MISKKLACIAFLGLLSAGADSRFQYQKNESVERLNMLEWTRFLLKDGRRGQCQQNLLKRAN